MKPYVLGGNLGKFLYIFEVKKTFLTMTQNPEVPPQINGKLKTLLKVCVYCVCVYFPPTCKALYTK